MGKGLGAGHAAISAMMISHKINEVFLANNYNHGHTFETIATSLIVAIKVLDIIQRKKLKDNVIKQSIYLENSLKS